MTKKMTCREFIEGIEGYLEAAMPPERRTACDEHLAECPYCRDYMKTHRESIELMKRALCVSLVLVAAAQSVSHGQAASTARVLDF